MEPEFTIQQLFTSGEAIHAMASGITLEQARWRPAPDSWSMVEVINHLFDEEREDFRAHLQGALQTPVAAWTPIAPQQWVTERRYQERDLDTSLQKFQQERAQSLAWLKTLAAPDWQAAYTLPWGQLSAGDLLASWAAHDQLHLRQLVELRYGYLAQAARPFEVRYAGEW